MENMLNELDQEIRDQVEEYFTNTDRFFTTIRNACGRVSELGNPEATRVANDVLASCNALRDEFTQLRATVTGQENGATAGAANLSATEIQTLQDILAKVKTS